MAVTQELLQNAFNITVEEELTDTDNITKDEIDNFKYRFSNLLTLLKTQAADTHDEDKDD